MALLPLRVPTDLSFDEIRRAMNAEFQGGKTPKISGVALDTRAVEKHDLFFALKASRDGHDFIEEAFGRGAAAAVVQREGQASGPCLRVKDTTEALGSLANFARKKWGKTIVSVCGSNGKTTTKEMTASVIGAGRNVHKTPGNWNNALGVPLTLLLLRPEHDMAVLEMGINEFGEMTMLARIAEPTVGLLTNVGPEHLEKFGSIDGVAKAEGELFEALPSGGTAVVNIDDVRIRALAERISARKVTISIREKADVAASVIRDDGAGGVLLRIKYGAEELELRSPFMGTHNIYNLLCALGAAFAVGIPASVLQAGVSAARTPDMRLETIACSRNIRILNDCYNANPASVSVALEVAEKVSRGRHIAVLGDMLELGDYSARAHRDIGIKVANHRFAYLFLMGRFGGDTLQGAIQGGMKEQKIRAFDSHAELEEALADVLEPNDTILIKGSRGMKMEKITEGLVRRLKEGES